MDPRAKDPEATYKRRQQAMLHARAIARKKFEETGEKPGPKVHQSPEEFFDYTNKRLEKDRSDIHFWIEQYKRQPLFLRAQIANHPMFQEVLATINADIGLGLYKVSREEWNALTILFNRITKSVIEKEKTERKQSRKVLREKHDHDEILTAVRVESEDDGEE